MIAPSDCPGLVRRLDELRDAMATVPEMHDDLLAVVADPPLDLLAEVQRLLAEPKLRVAIESLIFGSSEAWWVRRPVLREIVATELWRIAYLPERRTAWAAAS